MDTLPDETLLKIMSFLPLEDRRGSRLVCNRWNRISYDRHLIKNDTTIVRKLEDLNKYSSTTRHVKVKISDYPGSYIESSFWKTHGEHIEELILPNFGLNLRAIPKILKFCPNLKILILNVDDCDDDDENSSSSQSFEFISPISLSKLEEITLRNFDGVNALVLDALFSNSPRLKILRIVCCYFVIENAKLLLPIIRRCGGVLKVLDFRGSCLEVDMFAEITEQVQSQLQVLLAGLEGTPPNSLLVAFFEKFVNLKHLQLFCNGVISSIVIEKIALLFEKLTHLSLGDVDFSDVSRPALISLGRMKRLIALGLDCTNITKENLIAIFSVTNLKLEKLHLSNQPIDRETLLLLCPNLPNLLELEFYDCTIEEDAFEIICMYNKKLKYLSADRSILSPISESINNLKDLKQLNFDGCQNISGSLSSFKLPNLECISLKYVDVNEADVESMIEGCPSLYDVATVDEAIAERFKNILEGRRGITQLCYDWDFFADII